MSLDESNCHMGRLEGRSSIVDLRPGDMGNLLLPGLCVLSLRSYAKYSQWEAASLRVRVRAHRQSPCLCHDLTGFGIRT